MKQPTHTLPRHTPEPTSNPKGHSPSPKIKIRHRTALHLTILLLASSQALQSSLFPRNVLRKDTVYIKAQTTISNNSRSAVETPCLIKISTKAVLVNTHPKTPKKSSKGLKSQKTEIAKKGNKNEKSHKNGSKKLNKKGQHPNPPRVRIVNYIKFDVTAYWSQSIESEIALIQTPWIAQESSEVLNKLDLESKYLLTAKLNASTILQESGASKDSKYAESWEGELFIRSKQSLFDDSLENAVNSISAFHLNFSTETLVSPLLYRHYRDEISLKIDSVEDFRTQIVAKVFEVVASIALVLHIVALCAFLDQLGTFKTTGKAVPLLGVFHSIMNDLNLLVFILYCSRKFTVIQQNTDSLESRTHSLPQSSQVGLFLRLKCEFSPVIYFLVFSMLLKICLSARLFNQDLLEVSHGSAPCSFYQSVLTVTAVNFLPLLISLDFVALTPVTTLCAILMDNWIFNRKVYLKVHNLALVGSHALMVYYMFGWGLAIVLAPRYHGLVGFSQILLVLLLVVYFFQVSLGGQFRGLRKNKKQKIRSKHRSRRARRPGQVSLRRITGEGLALEGLEGVVDSLETIEGKKATKKDILRQIEILDMIQSSSGGEEEKEESDDTSESGSDHSSNEEEKGADVELKNASLGELGNHREERRRKRLRAVVKRVKRGSRRKELLEQLGTDCSICFSEMNLKGTPKKKEDSLADSGEVEANEGLHEHDGLPCKHNHAGEGLENGGCEVHDQNLFLTGCGHLFHQACLEPWIYTTGKCPICKKEINLRECLIL